MPLPSNTSIPLQAYVRPGDVVPSRPKQAMIVRMSAETFDALHSFPNHPQMDFMFGDKPGIYIGDTFFPMRPLKEDTPHELYLRAASSATKKPNGLKLYANVTGKFTVERELGHVEDKIREVTANTNRQNDRKTILIDTPPDLTQVHPKKRKKEPAMFRNPRPVEPSKSHVSAPAPTAPLRVDPSPNSKPAKKDGSVPLRKRFVHYLAISERTREQIVKMVGGADCSTSTRHEISELLDELAELSAPAKKGEDPSSRTWRLQPKAWLEVRPFEWPKLSDAQRLAMARTGRQKLGSLRIPESDAAWSHVRYRPGANGGPPSGPSTSSPNPSTLSSTKVGNQGTAPHEAPKRGVTSKEAREKKARPKPDPKAGILMKDESVKATIRENASRLRETPVDPSLAPSKPPARKPPGSGFRVGKSTSQDGRSDTADASGSNTAHRSKPVDVRTAKERELTKLSPLQPAPKPPPREEKPTPSVQPQRIKKIKGDAGGGTDTERDRVFTGVRDKPRTKQRDDQERPAANDRDVAAPKRKKPIQDDDGYEAAASRSAPQKKRRTENGSVHTAPAAVKEIKTSSAHLPEKPSSPAPRPAVKKEKDRPPQVPVQPPLPKIRKDVSSRPLPDGKASPRESSSSVQDRKSNGPIKPRRRSPIYTSSEDETDPRRTSRDAVPLPTPPMTMDAPSATYPRARPKETRPQPLPTDHAALRNRYNQSYREYISTFQKILAQKGKLDNMLQSNEAGSAGSITDSDGDVELMDAEELMKLKVDHCRLNDELTAILEVFKP